MNNQSNQRKMQKKCVSAKRAVRVDLVRRSFFCDESLSKRTFLVYLFVIDKWCAAPILAFMEAPVDYMALRI